VNVNDLTGVEFSGRVTAIDSVVDESTGNVQAQATLANPDGKLATRHVSCRPSRRRRDEHAPCRCPHPRFSYAPSATPCSWSPICQDPSGKPYRGAGSSFGESRARARRSDLHSVRREGGPMKSSGPSVQATNGAAVQINNTVRPGNSRSPKPRTADEIHDLFVKRPVLALSSPRLLIAGLAVDPRAQRGQYPRSDIAVVTVTTAYVGANADPCAASLRTPLERVIASADGIDYMESSSAQGLSTIHGAPET